MQLKEMFDYRDGCLYWKKARGRVSAGNKVGSYNAYGYLRTTIDGKSKMVHRLIWELHNGEIPENMQIDHINGITDDNRLENLRLATRSQNQLNQASKCYYYDARSDCYQVIVCVNGIRKHIGTFKDEELAELVANEAKDKYYGEFKRV